MTPDKILEIDAKRNHPPGTVAGNLRAVINDNTKRNGGAIRQGNTLVTFRTVAPKTILFFCFTADDESVLSKNLELVFKMFRKLKAEVAGTINQGPNINAALKRMGNKFPSQVSVKDGTPVAEVRL
jgi:hypothetical protein